MTLYASPTGLGEGSNWLSVFPCSPSPWLHAPKLSFQLFEDRVLLLVSLPLKICSFHCEPSQPPRPSLFMTDFGLSFGLLLDVPSRIFPWPLNLGYMSSHDILCFLSPQCLLVSSTKMSKQEPVSVQLNCLPSGLRTMPGTYQDLDQYVLHDWLGHTPCLKEAFNLVGKADTHSAMEWKVLSIK